MSEEITQINYNAPRSSYIRKVEPQPTQMQTFTAYYKGRSVEVMAKDKNKARQHAASALRVRNPLVLHVVKSGE
jgi:hypothetical protein